MNVSDNNTTQIDDPAISGTSAELFSGSSAFWKTAAPSLLLLGGVAAVAGVARMLPLFLNDYSTPVLRIVLAASAVSLSIAMTLRHRRQWVLPSIHMRRLIHEIRIGRAPLDEFNQLHYGSLDELADELKLLLHDLRQQRQSISELKEEARRRIAQRTSTLERIITSLGNQSVRDPLTGLYNRRMLDQLLPELILHLQAERKSLTLMVINVDYFKDLNDTLGHAAGDQLLKAIGQIVHSTIRDGDFAFRQGGDEFVLLLPACEPQMSVRISERLQSLVTSLAKTYKLPQPPRLSIGISSLADLPQPTGAALLKRADERLCEAKTNHPTPPAAATQAA